MASIEEELSNANEYYQGKEYEKSMEHCNKVLANDPSNETAHFIAGLCAYDIRKLADCTRHFEHCMSKVKEQDEVWERYAFALSKTGRGDEASVAFEEIIKAFPEESRAKFNYGYFLLDRKENLKAIQYLRKAEDAGYKNEKLYFYLGVGCYNSKNYSAAIMYLNKALEFQPEDPEIPMLLGNSYFNSGDYEKAIEHYSRVLYYNEKNYNAVYWRLIARVNQKDTKGKIVNHAGAQEDADKLFPEVHRFFELNDKDGMPLIIKEIEVSEKGELNFKVS